MASAIMTLLVWNSKQSHAALLTLGPVRLHSAWSVTAARSAIRANGFDRRLEGAPLVNTRLLRCCAAKA
jgi:hypothetical protein